MLQTLKQVLGLGPKVDFGNLIKSGAQVIDVRTQSEYKQGHIRGSLNIPLQTLQSSISKIKKDKPIIMCCASGIRSSSAKNLLKSKGFKEVYNGGSWQSLQNKIK